ncbi:MAG TPA: HD domain-containing protein [Bdellovibrionales bacterium]|nr:HD domain-containing protein [Bdellovibrionales bacterium]
MPKLYKKHIFDNIHGYIYLTRCEDRIMNTAYYQRLRWIRQLGFSFYIFSGATHTRFSHALGVLHIMHRILHSIKKAVPDEQLFDPDFQSEAANFNRMMRIAAMLHDIGTFPFSHTTELGYINHWKKQKAHGNGKKLLDANHETLGSHIILNTDFEGGITKILKEEGIDPVELSKIIAGKSNNLLANQLMHSDIDADRMDYLLRDAYYTGTKYGLYDMDFLIRHLTTFQVDGQESLAVKDEAINVAEYFLISRYSWYSQIIDDGTGYKFDLIAAKITEYFLENGQIHSFDQLIKTVSLNPDQYFTFNDNYFFAKVHEYLAGETHHPLIKELAHMLAYRVPPKQIKIPPAEPTLIESEEHRQEMVSSVQEVAQWLENELKNLDPNAWMVVDIPTKDVIFTKNYDALRKDLKAGNPLLLRDPVKIVTRHGEAKLLIDVHSALLKILSQYRNFFPRIYVSNSTYELLTKNKVLEEMLNRYKGRKTG